jgi:hypothetical protein
MESLTFALESPELLARNSAAVYEASGSMVVFIVIFFM